MPTRNIVPRGDGEGSVGTSVKKWDAIWANKIKNVDVDDLIAPIEDYRQPNTAYTAGTIKYHASLPTGYYLECTTAGTTSSGDLSVGTPDVYDTITDGTVTWTVCNVHLGTFNTKQTFTSSGTFTAPVSGTYRITLQGGGGGGSGAGTAGATLSGGGGGQGGHLEFYEELTVGISYNYTIGAGGTGSAGGTSTSGSLNGTSGGASSITIGQNEYLAEGGEGAYGTGNASYGGASGHGKKNGTNISAGCPGASGTLFNAPFQCGGVGGGAGGGRAYIAYGNGELGGGGSGGGINNYSSTYAQGGNGGDGYITFEWFDTSLL